MREGKTLQVLAVELDRRRDAQRDFYGDSRNITLQPVRKHPDLGGRMGVRLHMEGITDVEGAARQQLGGRSGSFGISSYAHGQIASHTGMPKAHYDRLLEASPQLLTDEVNFWLKREPKKRLVRTLDGRVRAFLSDSYRQIDNADLAEAVLPALEGLDAKVVSCEITDKRFYLKAVTERVQGEVAQGDIVQAGIVVSNSEVGSGALKIEEFALRLVCLNGMISQVAQRRTHLGRRSDLGALNNATEYWKDETRRQSDKALFLQIRDSVAAIFDAERFAGRVAEYRRAAEDIIPAATTIPVMEALGRRLQLSEGEQEGVLGHLIAGGDLSRWGVANAVTRFAEDAADYDRATDFERMGGTVIELPRTDWEKLATAS